MTSLRLTTDGEIDLTNGSPSLISGADATIQRITQRLRAFQGNWFLDLVFGVPYFGRIFVRNVNEGDLFQIYNDVIANTPGVVSVDELTLTLPTSDDRDLRIEARVTVTESVEVIPIDVSINALLAA
jgi:hypothetical protein